jgi:hypothetical protein
MRGEHDATTTTHPQPREPLPRGVDTSRTARTTGGPQGNKESLRGGGPNDEGEEGGRNDETAQGSETAGGRRGRGDETMRREGERDHNEGGGEMKR